MQPYTVGGKLAGYVKNVGNLRHVILRDAGHSVPRYQPEVALLMFKDFLENGHAKSLDFIKNSQTKPLAQFALIFCSAGIIANVQ